MYYFKSVKMDKTKNLPDDKEEKSVEKLKKSFSMFLEHKPDSTMKAFLSGNSKELDELKKHYPTAKKIVEKPEGDETVEKPEGDTIRKGIYATWNKIKSFFEARRP